MKPILLADRLQRALAGGAQLLAEHSQRAVLSGAQGTDQRQQRRLAAARRPGDDDDLAGVDVGRDVEEDLLAEIAGAVGVIEATDGDGR